MSSLRLALATFDNVFDTTPNRRVVSLEQLLDGLSRFELRDDVAAKIARREGHIRQAWTTLDGGGLPAGKEGSALIEARKQAESEGRDGMTAAREARDKLMYEAHHDAKRLIALWSPACFVQGGRRTGDDVAHLSCLVFDYDAGIELDAVETHWAGHFAAIHTTWSHTPERPRLRAVLPLARPVDARDWDAVWAWGSERAEHLVDPAPKGRASTFALPAVGGADWPFGSWLRPGELLDPVAMGLAREASPAPAVAWHKPHHFDGGRPKKRQLRADSASTDAIEVDALRSDPVDEGGDLDFDAFG